MSHTPSQPGEWFPPSGRASDDDADVQLFLFPHAGGTGAMYREWAATMPATVEPRVLHLPGRWGRGDEAPLTRLPLLLARIGEALEAELDGRPYAFFGHSFGALLAYRLAVQFEKEGMTAPSVLAVSGWVPGEDILAKQRAVSEMSDDELVAAVKELGLLPTGSVLAEELLRTALPALRADFGAAAQYLDDGAQVSCPVVAFAGRSDPLVVASAMGVWADRTSNFVGVTEYPGDHFYLFDHAISMQLSLQQLLQLPT
ncbi:thioesterase II family protein [Streptomyces olivaceoviridis]